MPSDMRAPAAMPAPFLSVRGGAIALLLALVLGWPMLALGGYLIFADTEPYIRGGRIVWQMILDLLPAAGAGDGGAASGAVWG